VSRALRALPRPIAALGLALALACATAREPAPTPLPASDPRPAALLGSVTHDAATRRSLRGVARLAIDGPAGAGRAKQILVLERPARLRVEVLGLLDQTLAVLVTDGARYRLVRSQDRSVDQGPVYDALLVQVTAKPLQKAQPGSIVTDALADLNRDRVGMLPVPVPASARREHRRPQADLGRKDLVLEHVAKLFLETADEYFDYHPPHKPAKSLWNSGHKAS